MGKKHPSQRLYKNEHGTVRFQPNAVVRYLLDNGSLDLNHLAMQNFSDEDQAQFAQLIGYSVSAWGGLSYVTEEQCTKADIDAENLLGIEGDEDG